MMEAQLTIDPQNFRYTDTTIIGSRKEMREIATAIAKEIEIPNNDDKYAVSFLIRRVSVDIVQ